MKKMDQSAMKKRNLIVKFSFSTANCRNRTMLYCDLFIHLLPSSIIQPWNKIHSEICVEMEKVPVSPLQHIFLLSRHIFGMFKTAMIMLQYSIAQILNNVFKNKKRNVLCHWYIYAMKEKDCPPCTKHKRASSWDYGTYHISDHRRLRRACASAQSQQSLRCSQTRRMEVDEGSDQKSDI